MTDKPAVILVHGAWHGAWCWERVAPLLEQAGHRILAPDLPGHGHNSLPLKSVTFKRYTEAMCDAVSELQEPVILVGHSMAGMLISAVAEAMPERIHCLLFLNAYIPANGDSVFSLMQNLFPDSEISSAMTLTADKRGYSLDDANIRELFYAQTENHLQEKALSLIQQQASLPLNTAVELSGTRYGSVRKIAMCSTQDRVIPPVLQRLMLHRQPCDEFVQVEGDHSLFYCAPEEVAAVISAQSRTSI